MRVIVTGGRDYAGRRQIAEALRKLPRDTTIVHGACRTGADWIADVEAKALGLTVEPHPAQWRVYGIRAGTLRNQEMADLGADLCMVFPGGKGTSDMERRAIKAGIKVEKAG